MKARISKKVYSMKQAKKALPRRTLRDNKTVGGKALVVAGSHGMWGAAVLTAKACARVGAGYVYVSDHKFPSVRHPDFLLLNTKKNFNFSALAIGPGLSDSDLVRRWIQKCIRNGQKKVVLDAEALNVMARWKKAPQLPSTWILTPHEGELARLLGVSSSQIKMNREKFVLAAQKKFKTVVLLKGYRTLVADGFKVFEIQSGNPALAKAGTGDVLTGMILGLLSQGLSSSEAACLGAFVHGTIADHWVKEGNDVLSLMASDLVDRLPTVLKFLRTQS